MAPQRKNVIVIGAGVIGLQTALTLLEEGNDSYQVYVVAEFLPGDEDATYASAWAGAQWRSHETSYTEAASWDAETYRAWTETVKSERDCGLALMTGVNYWTSPDVSTSSLSTNNTDKDEPQNSRDANFHSPEANSTVPEPWWSTLVSEYESIERSLLPPGVIFGVKFTTFTIDPIVYLPYLLGKIKGRGGHIYRCKLPTEGGIESAAERAAEIAGLENDERIWAVVNATGLAAKDMVGDEAVYPIRGQTVRVKGVAKQVTTKLGKAKSNVAAVMPRPSSNCTIIGVTVEEGVWETEVEEKKVPVLLDRARDLAPELLTAQESHEVLKIGVGLRPGRRGGARVELAKGRNGLVVAHAYGHAGAGYQNSVGCARKVLKMLNEYHD